MLVNPENFEECLLEISKLNNLGLDTETDGKYWWKSRLFSIIISTIADNYYFDFNGVNSTLKRQHLEALVLLFSDPTKIWYIANAKFDLHMLANEDLHINGEVICILARERVIQNNLMKYNLNTVSKKYLNEQKDETVDTYINEHGLFDKELIPGKKKISTNKHFAKVPLTITQPYGEKDARLHLNVGLNQNAALNDLDGLYPRTDVIGSINDVAENEIILIKTCQQMERIGIKINVSYTEAAIKYENGVMLGLKEDFQKLTGVAYQDSRTTFVRAFETLGLSYPTTEKGNPSFNKEALALVENPIAELIRGIRKFDKRIGTYYSSFLYFRDRNDVLHPNINTGGTETGRMSYSDPNLQNVPKEDEESDLSKPFLVRGCFTPRQGSCFVAIDYKQMEFRMLLDYAGETELINAINEGADPHDATAAATGLSRKAAKTLNFGLLYGMGIQKLAHALKVHPLDAEKMRAQYFGKMRNVSRFIKRVNQTAKNRMYVRNWMGRICHINDTNFSYILLNHLIQGGCADVVKVAMNRAQEMLAHAPSDLLLQVHDELLFESKDRSVMGLRNIQEMMDSVYKPQNGMRLITNAEHSFVSWAKKDMREGLPA